MSVDQSGQQQLVLPIEDCRGWRRRNGRRDLGNPTVGQQQIDGCAAPGPDILQKIVGCHLCHLSFYEIAELRNSVKLCFESEDLSSDRTNPLPLIRRQNRLFCRSVVLKIHIQ